METNTNQVNIFEKLDILIEINETISRNLNLKESLNATLKILQQLYKINSGAIFLVEDESDIIRPVAHVGFKQDFLRGKFRVGEGLTGRIVESGNPITVPMVSQEPLFMNRYNTWNPKVDSELSYIGVPISLDYKTLGALVITFPFETGKDYEVTVKFLSLVASALLQPIRVQKIIEQERKTLIDENVTLKHKLQDEFSISNIIGNSHEMREIIEQTGRIAHSDTTVIIRGESGTGKELVAEAIHYNSSRKDQPFIRVNCAAIPENLIESEFFGYEKGAFTGADKTKKGRFELADKGTIFLDEVGDLSKMTQTKLLRVLQEQEFQRVGGTKTIKVDVRVIAATNADLENMIEENTFREDLYYRLNVFSLVLPPLRERKTDILLLADHFMLKYGRKHKKSVKRISTPAIDLLMSYHWPGNVRELENCIERAVVMSDDQVIHSYSLPATLQSAESSNTYQRLSLKESVSNYEKEIIQDALKQTQGNIAKAARILSSTERILGYKISKYHIRATRFKN